MRREKLWGLWRREGMVEFGWWPSMTGTRDLELAGLLVHGGTGVKVRGVGGLGSGARPHSASGAASRELLSSSRSPITPHLQRAMQGLKFIFWQGESWSWE